MVRLIAVIALGLSGVAIAPAHAQIAQQGGPIEVNADALEALTNEGRYIYTKNVDAVQGDARLKSDKLTVICDAAPADPKAQARDRAAQSCGGGVRTLIAEGNVYYLTPDGRIKGDRAEYDYSTKVITITGNVVLARGSESVVNGRKLIYEVDAGRATMTNDGGRVTSFFTPQKTDKAAAPASPGASPSPSAPR